MKRLIVIWPHINFPKDGLVSYGGLSNGTDKLNAQVDIYGGGKLINFFLEQIKVLLLLPGYNFIGKMLVEYLSYHHLIIKMLIHESSRAFHCKVVIALLYDRWTTKSKVTD